MTYLLNLLDIIIEKNKNITYLSGLIMLIFLCIQMYDIKKQIVLHSDFIAEVRRANVIKQAESIRKNIKYLSDVELRLAIQYCDEVDQKGSLNKNCEIIYEYLNNPKQDNL
jgi:hypothetical protein